MTHEAKNRKKKKPNKSEFARGVAVGVNLALIVFQTSHNTAERALMDAVK